MPAPEGKPSLTEYAAALKPKPSCRVCDLPEVAEVNAARKAGVSYKVITRWLIDVQGYEPGFISHHRVEAHFHQNHHG